MSTKSASSLEEHSPGSAATSREASEDEAGDQLIGEEINLAEILQTEVEIKEEEIEVDESFLPEQDNECDPIGYAPKIEEASGSTTVSADETYRHEAIANQNRKQKEKAKPVIRKRKKRRNKPKNNGLVLARFVPGVMVRRKNKLLCLECGEQFESLITFASHQRRFHMAQLKRFPYACSYCPRKFRGKLALHRHMLHHSRLEAIQCPVCQKVVHTAFGLADHLANHQAVVHRCNLCSLVFQSSETLVAHNFSNHSKHSLYSKNVRLNDHVCFACGAMEVTKSALKVHLSAHQDPLQCKVCYETSTSADSFLEHMLSVHNNQAELTYYCCPNCPKSFLSAGLMRKHCLQCKTAPKRDVQPLDTSNRMDCEICELTYYDLDHFATHMRLHGSLSRELGFQPTCPLCSYVAKSMAEHAIHMVQVHGFRDRMRSLEEDYRQLNVVPAKGRKSPGVSTDSNLLPTTTDSSDDD